jgi:hypothetical protein
LPFTPTSTPERLGGILPTAVVTRTPEVQALPRAGSGPGSFPKVTIAAFFALALAGLVLLYGSLRLRSSQARTRRK